MRLFWDLRTNGEPLFKHPISCWAAAGAVVGAGISAYGAKRAASKQGQGNVMTEQARQEAIRHVSMGNIRNVGNQLFPGLVGFGKTSVDPKIMDTVRGGGPAPTHETRMIEDIKGKAQGGPIEKDEPVMVGEEGPEIVVPQEDGEVIPSPGTKPGFPTLPTPGEPSPEPGIPIAPGEEGAPEVREGVVGTPGDPTLAPGGLGELSMGHAINFLTNPGQIGTEQFERAQEQANVGLQTNIQGMMGGLTGMGVDPRSPMAQIMMQGAVNQSNKLRNEAARDLSIQQENLRRGDIQTGMTAYQNFLNQVFNLIGMQADVIGGGDFQNIQNPINPYQNIGGALAEGGLLLAGQQGPKTQGPPS